MLWNVRDVWNNEFRFKSCTQRFNFERPKVITNLKYRFKQMHREYYSIYVGCEFYFNKPIMWRKRIKVNQVFHSLEEWINKWTNTYILLGY